MSEELLQRIHAELQGIHAASVAQTQLISNASTYALGYAISFGMNYALDEKIFPAAFYALFSWVNVGYVLVKHVGDAWI